MRIAATLNDIILLLVFIFYFEFVTKIQQKVIEVNKKSSEEANKKTAEGLSKAADVSTEGEAIMATQEPSDENVVQKRKDKLLSERPSNKKSFAFWKDSDLQKKYLEELGFDEKTGLTEQEKKQGYIRLDENANPIKKMVSQPETQKTSMPDQTDAETARLNRQNAAAAPVNKNEPKM